MRNITDSNDLQAHLRNLLIRLERLERHTHAHGGQSYVITAVTERPPTPEPTLLVDTRVAAIERPRGWRRPHREVT